MAKTNRKRKMQFKSGEIEDIYHKSNPPPPLPKIGLYLRVEETLYEEQDSSTKTGMRGTQCSEWVDCCMTLQAASCKTKGMVGMWMEVAK
jgi:hypothetical protein